MPVRNSFVQQECLKLCASEVRLVGDEICVENEGDGKMLSWTHVAQT